MMRVLHLTLILAVFSLTACSGGLVRLTSPSDGPDEFLVVPSKPLEQPDDFNALPTPTPGGANRSDLQPLQDSIAALGGTRRAATSGSIPAGDSAVVSYSSRLGRDGTIRDTLASEDATFRKRRSRLSKFKIGTRDDYALIYQRHTLDAHAENQRWRQAGARTPTAPPE